MKIRIRGNSVRFRLTKTEVETFSKAGFIEEKTAFGNRTFSYAVKTSSAVDNLRADFEDDTITLYLPQKDGQEWFEDEKVGFENTIRLNNDQELYLLLEKDFACLDNTIEDQSDNYPNPKASG